MTLLRPTLVVLSLQLSVSVAVAQQAPGDAVQLTPFVSMDSRGSTPIGGAISFPLGSSFDLEAEATYRESGLATHASLLYDLPRLGRTRPYLAAGVGLAQFGAPVVAPGTGLLLGVSPQIALEVNAGGGIKVPVADTWGMRTDARWFKSFGRHASEHFRVAQGISFDVKR
jgi:hypothetical protein